MIHALVLGLILQGTSTPVLVLQEQRMFADVNATRARAGIPPLSLDPRLDRVAVQHAMDMAQNQYFSHDSENGETPFDRMTDAHISFTAAGENIAAAPDEPSAYQGLLASPEHLANILRRNFHRIGIGAVQGPDGEMFFVQDFTN